MDVRLPDLNTLTGCNQHTPPGLLCRRPPG